MLKSERERSCVTDVREHLFAEAPCRYVRDAHRHPEEVSITWPSVAEAESPYHIMSAWAYKK